MTPLDKLGNESAVVFLHACPCLFNLIQQTPAFLYLSRESASHYSFCAFDVLGGNQENAYTDHNRNPKDILR